MPVWQKRQATSDVSTTTTPPSRSGSPGPASSNSSPSSALQSTTYQSNTGSSSTSSPGSQTALSSAVTSMSTTTGSPASASLTRTSQTSAATVLSDALPIQPEITPALGIAGVILLGTGVALCLIGVKHKWLQTFLSTALLTSLAVLVLIVYVMTPPVQETIQGAYLVAIVATGLIFGSVSIVFKEITEGLGCLLGGFCLGMWFLCLSPGGLIKTTTGRAIMIATMCGVGFSLSFSRYTRQYGLIVLTSFAGAQVTIVGVDCFSRAGLKEFWLYIWGEFAAIYHGVSHPNGHRLEFERIPPKHQYIPDYSRHQS